MSTSERYNAFVTFSQPWDQVNGIISVKDDGGFSSFYQFFTLKPTTKYTIYGDVYSETYHLTNANGRIIVIAGHTVASDWSSTLVEENNSSRDVWTTLSGTFTSPADGKIGVYLASTSTYVAAFRNIYLEEQVTGESLSTENHVICTYKNGEQHIYVDGEEAETTPISKTKDYTPGSNTQFTNHTTCWKQHITRLFESSIGNIRFYKLYSHTQQTNFQETLFFYCNLGEFHNW